MNRVSLVTVESEIKLVTQPSGIVCIQGGIFYYLIHQGF